MAVIFSAKFWSFLGLLVSVFATASNAAATRTDLYENPVHEERTHDFDVLHYRIELTLEESNRSFNGQTTIRLRALRDQFGSFVLDAETFLVDSVIDKSGGVLSFSHDNGKLAIKLNAQHAAGDLIEVKVAYRAVNVDVDGAEYGVSSNYDLGLDFKSETESNPQLINTLSFPEGARHWFPSYDHPSDRATQETIVTARADYEVISNGRLIEITENADGATKTTTWRQDQNHPTYLFVLVAGPYVRIDDNYGDIPLGYWVYPEAASTAPIAFAKTARALEFLEELYGVKYPWVKYDQITIPGIGGGAESTSATVVGESIIRDPSSYEDFPSAGLVAHEAAHHWFGNLIAYRDWTHMWLAESFATYSEYRFSKDDLGSEEGAVNLLKKKEQYLREAREKYMRSIVFDRWIYANDNFDSHSYPKGAVVLNMLASLIGNDKFHRTLKTFLLQHSFESVATEDFVAVAEEVAGEDLEWFFEQWLYSPGHPVFDVSYHWNEEGNEVALTIQQVQDTSGRVPVFRAPVKIGITTDAEVKTHMIWVEEKSQTFILQSAAEPLMVRFDVGDVLLKEWTFKKGLDELLYQLRNDNNIGRAWAARELGDFLDVQEVVAALTTTAEGDSFWDVRNAAIDVIGKSKQTGFESLFMRVAKRDPHSRARAAAIAALSGSTDEKTVKFIEKTYDRDRSYLVRAQALKALGATGDVSWKEFIEDAAKTKSPRNVLKNAADEALVNF